MAVNEPLLGSVIARQTTPSAKPVFESHKLNLHNALKFLSYYCHILGCFTFSVLGFALTNSLPFSLKVNDYETSYTTYAHWHRCLRSGGLHVGGNRSTRRKPTCLTW